MEDERGLGEEIEREREGDRGEEKEGKVLTGSLAQAIRAFYSFYCWNGLLKVSCLKDTKMLEIFMYLGQEQSLYPSLHMRGAAISQVED